MPRELYPEHKMTPLLDVVRVCIRCKSGLVYTPNLSFPRCDKCGDNDREGEPYVRLSEVQDKLSSLADVVVEDGKFLIKALTHTVEVKNRSMRRGNHRR